jgi:dihydropteroate synthase
MRRQYKIMGILNLTPDSFSDGGKFNKINQAIQRVKEMEEEGADIIDIGGESTGPNSKNVSTEEEVKRVIPILQAIKKISKLPISIDSYKAEVVSQALQEGAEIVNDISALRFDPNLVKVIAKSQCKVVMMYSKDISARTTVKNEEYEDIIKHIENFFEERINFAKENGIKKDRIIIDPGMGQFVSNNPKYSYEIIERLAELKKLNPAILLGISRKSFLGGTLEKRDEKALRLTAIAYLNGASIIRTHNIKGTKQLIKTLG